MSRYGLRDDQWDQIKDFLFGRAGHVVGTAADNRLFIESVIYRYRAAIPYRGMIFRHGLATGKWLTNVYGGGLEVVF
jgi:hypothetical protein